MTTTMPSHDLPPIVRTVLHALREHAGIHRISLRAGLPGKLELVIEIDAPLREGDDEPQVPARRSRNGAD
jgi:hypothetical protein